MLRARSAPGASGGARRRLLDARGASGARRGGGMKVAGAPISWGVNELPVWGHRMPPERVLAEMHELGLEATELGPPGYLPEDAASRRDLLDRNGLRLCAGFLAAVLHDPSRTPRDAIEHEAAALAGSGAEVLVLAAALPGDTYDAGRRLTPAEWACLAERVSEAADVSQSHGLELAVHLHAGTAIATADGLRILVDTTKAGLCLDTGHMFLGGADSVAVRSEEHTSELQSHVNLVCRLLLE